MGRSYTVNESKGHPGFTALVVIVLAVCVTGFIASSSFFVVRTILVTGAQSVSEQEVIVTSGLRQGQSIFFIDQAQVRKNINGHKTLLFSSLDIKFPSTVILTVHEREAVAQIEYLGFMYAMDETGRVLYKSADILTQEELPVIKGMTIKSITEGEELSLSDSDQLKAVCDLLAAVRESSMHLTAHELNVSDLENLYIMTRDGVKVELGTIKNISVKLAIAQAVIRDQGDRNLLGAKIDVSSGNDAYFIPGAL